MTFRKNYALAALLLFVIEALIALFIRDKFIRPYLGDFLVVILLYCFVRAFFKIQVVAAAVAVLLFTFAIEAAQHFKLVKLLGLQDNRIASTVIGTSAEWPDLIAYTLGIAVVLAVEYGGLRRIHLNKKAA